MHVGDQERHREADAAILPVPAAEAPPTAARIVPSRTANAIP
jgi:hypothetical protein